MKQTKTDAEKLALALHLANLNQAGRYKPYDRQREFHAAGANYRERILMAGNQLGKTLAAGFEVQCHATGCYPKWWRGRKWDRPTKGWVSGESSETTRDNPQKMLMGEWDEFGTGMLPKGRITRTVTARGTPEALDSVVVKHKSGGHSYIGFKSYQQGVDKWRGSSLDYVWFDEEPPADVYAEGLTRTNKGSSKTWPCQGMVFITFTPLQGATEVVNFFYPEPSTRERHTTQMTIDDVEHYTDEEKRIIIDGYLPHEREARSKGIPMLGSGRVYPIEEERVVCPVFKIPDHYALIGGMDFGIDHPFGAVLLAWDRDGDRVFVIREYRLSGATPTIHKAALRPWGAWIPWSWPHDGHVRDKGSGHPIASQYRDCQGMPGLNMLRDHATHVEGGFSTEAAVLEIYSRMETDRFKVFESCEKWISEFRMYHRKEGRIVNKRDDLMNATEKGIMSLRFARTILKKNFLPIVGMNYDPFRPQMVQSPQYDPFGG